MKLIIDTDPGIDDAMAYFYAHAHPDIDLVALTTVFGNVTTDDATRNALWLTQMSKARTEVYQGSDKPLQIVPNRPSDHVHGPHGFGDVQTDMTEPPNPPAMRLISCSAWLAKIRVFLRSARLDR
uniref:Nucleoside hydrolase n=1 Tax=Yoonia rhodophyticola TaxID=3137370 RepID=A0AAN0M9V0_9RHOB